MKIWGHHAIYHCKNSPLSSVQTKHNQNQRTRLATHWDVKLSATFSSTTSILVITSVAGERLNAAFATHRHLAEINCVCVAASLTIMSVLGKLRVLLLPHKRRLPSDRALYDNPHAAMRSVWLSTKFIFALRILCHKRGRRACMCVQWMAGSKLI